MSLLKILRKKNNIDLFTTPSHANKFFIMSKFRQFYKYDISETDAYEPQIALDLAQKKAAEIYKTNSTRFLINGSTSGIITAVLACVKKDEHVLIWKNSHPSHKNAVKLANANTDFYDIQKNEEWGIPQKVSPEIILDKLQKNPKIKAVIVTSPSYEGIVSDIKTISEICHRQNAYLIVDEAHGALYPFSDELPTSAIYQGADFVIQSLHKTAGGLNPTALIHNNTTLDIDEPLKCISTTSPSYPLLASIEKNINYLNSKKGKKNIQVLIDNIKELRKNTKNVEFYGDDLTKLIIKSSKYNGYQLSEHLYENNIEDEKTNDKSTMLLCGIGTSQKKLKHLQTILSAF